MTGKYVHTQVVHSDEPTFVLALMGVEAVQRIAKGKYVLAVSYKNMFSIKGNDC